MSATAAPPPPPIEMESLSGGSDAFPPPPQASPQKSNSGRRNHQSGHRQKQKEPPQEQAYNAGSTRPTTPSASLGRAGPGPQGDSQPSAPPPTDARFPSVEIGTGAPPPLSVHMPPSKRDLGIQETGNVVDLLDRQYLGPDDDLLPMRPNQHHGDRGGRRSNNMKGREDNVDSLGIPIGFRPPPRYGDPARYSSSDSDSQHSSSKGGCHGQGQCTLCASFLSHS